jgi:hypothetical protein
VNVAIVFGPLEYHGSGNSKDVLLEGEASIGERARRLAADEVSNRHVSERKKARPILQRLDRPALDPAQGTGDACWRA